MNKSTPYINEFISFLVMFLLLAALVSGQLYAPVEQQASTSRDSAEISHARMHGE
ncbi:MAG: hypothetical protein KJP08_07390 [Gammaproteobacteria bacterium]|nr:hypothetical protein [Gammaproteobacteria bacterium]NNF48770.1 hypothetical protein [Woeseiaceae bacterium]MBT8094615.1 hypothetical protein [Gammaproteobacteria bacterium]MBT8106380.1 hypothetical protein [Gammaproteobacteria bacterium]NNK26395.1 hypothetical protein [Woeseiaceae bacterium]